MAITEAYPVQPDDMLHNGLEEVASFEPLEECISVPQSADFSLEESIKVYESPSWRKPTDPIPKIVRLRHAKKVPRLASGLVDPSVLDIYLHHNPYAVPLKKTPGWKYHHMHYPKPFYKLPGVPPEENPLESFRSNSYNQVKLRISNEQVFHRLYEIWMARPPMETIEATLRDYERLDMLGAACMYLNAMEGSSQYGVDEGSLNPSWVEPVPLKDRISFIEEVREDHARDLIRAEVLPDRLVTSAIKRLSLSLQDPYLARLANRRLESDPVFYPVRTPSHKLLLMKVNNLIKLEFGLTDWEPTPALQTGANQLQ